MSAKIDTMKIVSNKMIASDVYEMKLQGEIAKTIERSGQFINIKLEDEYRTYLRRPMSISDYEDDMMTIVYKKVGHGTTLLTKHQVGDELEILMPLGNGFSTENISKALIIGGGVGVPPMFHLAKEYHAMGVEVEVILGFNSQKDVFYEEKFKELGTVHVCTMDGSYGMKGNVIDVIKELGITYDKYYACGPEKMLDALVMFDEENGYLSFEARMGCGFGACMGCSCKVKTKPYKRICVEGPVLKSSEVIVHE